MNTAFDQHPATCRLGNAREHGSGCADGQRTRRSRHEQQHAAIKTRAPRPAKHERQHHDDEQRADEHCGHKTPRKRLGEALRRALLLLRFGDELHHAGERVVAGQPRHAHIQRVVLIDGSCKDVVAGLALHGHALAGDRALIDAAFARRDHAIHRHALARLHDDDVIHGEFFHRHFFKPVAAFREGRARHEFPEHANGIARAIHRVMLPCVAEREEKQQERSLGPFAEQGRPRRRRNHEQVDVELAPKQSRQGRTSHIVAACQIGQQVEPERHRRGKSEELLPEESDHERHSSNRHRQR